MTSTPTEKRLSKITTNWDDLIAAHQSEFFDPEAADRRGAILNRYADCVYQYIFGATRCHHAAEDLSQDFALRFVRGDFRNANPGRGRFRDYLKRSLRNLITDYFRLENKKATSQTVDEVESKAIVNLEHAFSAQWRRQLLGVSWESLKDHETQSGSLYYSVLRLRAEFPTDSSDKLAKTFSSQHDRHVTAEWIRQTLKRARSKFANLLLNEVGRTIESDSAEELDDELATLGLQKYVSN